MPKIKSTQGVLALDLGTSSVRAVVYDTRGVMLAPTLCDFPYKVRTTNPGEVSSNPDDLVRLIAASIDAALKAAHKEKVDIVAAAAACYWHSLMGVDRDGRPTTELLTWADTRSAPETANLRTRFDERAYHGRTGCFFHASFWPAKLRWLQATRRPAVARTIRWISLAEYLYHRLLGEYRVSFSIASGTGLFDIHRCQWDAEALEVAGIDADHLSPLADRDQRISSLRPAFAKRWPRLRGVPWFLPLGDGALANVGAGCVDPRWLCATIGTSSALRVILDQNQLTVPWGAFVYRLDKKRYVLGGALSEGGNVVRWFTAGLGLKHEKQLERAAAAIPPDSHGLTVLPFWAGERSPNWRGDARAVIAGLSLGSQPAHLLRASMEAITYQLVAVAGAIEHAIARPRAVIATGGQLIHSAAWRQMLADAINIPVTTSPHTEASSRGAALLALESLGRLPHLWSTLPARGRTHRPRASVHTVYERARLRQQQLCALLLPPLGQPERATPIAAAGSGSRTTDLRTPAARH